MGNEKTGLGRALVKHHNHMIQQSKEKGHFFRNQHKKFLESVTDVSDIDAVIQHAEESDRFSDLPRAPSADPAVPIKLDMGSRTSDMTEEEREKQRKIEESLHASSLRVPRRPPWNSTMSVEELDENEHRSFLVWRHSLARLEENESLILTPFEKNLDIWRQLWRVVERSDLLVMVVDARDPLFYRCPDLEAYAREVDRYKRTLLLVNKADLFPVSLREKWAKFFLDHGILFLFWSAKAASAALDGRKTAFPWITQDKRHAAEDPHLKIYGREELLTRLQAEAEEIVKLRRESGSGSVDLSDACPASRQTASKSVTVGFVGYPNVGKSSTINALFGQKRTGVTSTPGKTKHFQTLIISEELTLCDCPGLVFPSFSSSRHEMIACGVLPIDRMTEHREAIQVVANGVPRHVFEEVYNVKLPKPKPYEPQNRPPLASELLRTYCASRGYVGSSGLPDETRAARQILKDYIDGKLPHFELPPGTSSEENNEEDTVDNRLAEVPEGEKSDLETLGDSENEDESAPVLDQVLNHLNSFDMENGLSTRKPSTKKPTASHKHHKKPQRNKDRSWRVRNDDGDGKDRSWRVRNDDGDGMPVVRVFQKLSNRGPEVTS